MRKNKGKILSILLITLTTISIGVITYAHSGRTDSSGGHRDNKNKSGLGSYHYHCGGYPAHVHPNGVCKYSSSKSNKSSSSSSSTKSKSTFSSTKTTTKTSVVAVKEIQINEKIESLEVGESETLTTKITPSNATDKKITWKSSNESIATVSSSGKVTAKNAGIVEITATSSNGKTSTLEISIQEEKRIESSNIVETSEINQNIITNDIDQNDITNDVTNNTMTNDINQSNVINNVTTSNSITDHINQNNIKNNMTTNNDITNNQEDSSILGGIVTLGLLGGGGYLGYKKFKNN